MSYIDLSNGWTRHIPDFNSIIFIKILIKDQIEASLIIRSDLYLTAFCQQIYQIDLSMNQVNDIRQIETLLLEIDCLPRTKITRNSEMPQPTVTTCLENAISNLEHVIKLLDHDDLDFDPRKL